MNVLNSVNQRHFEIKPGFQFPLEFFESMQQNSVLLWNHDDASEPSPVVLTNSLRVLILSLGRIGKRAELPLMDLVNGKSMLVKFYQRIHCLSY